MRTCLIVGVLVSLVGCGSSVSLNNEEAPDVLTLTDLQPGDANCAYGGVQITDGDTTHYVCNGGPGPEGAVGSVGPIGESVVVDPLPEGDADCPKGGALLTAGDTSAPVCNGNPGPAAVPVGGIVLWSGDLEAIPVGWALCDGENETPDLRSRFVVGAGSDYEVHATGGESYVSLSVSQIPAHTHGVGYTPTPNVEIFGSSVITVNQIAEGGLSTALTGSAGSGMPHENRPPYYALAYIMRVE